ncbi:MAG: DUF4197 domain-containing protein [Erythrobacter sp.]|uniref:DUF4197 domain-containing protein n=1 Tax=Erythrobacter sp. TaxID=1042 RepID=UPI002601850D|nr:DUF4197 domain-containing protein [Erythrobacter sp.]MDJ0979347.1 DUF4197 domain-containing protein [Erythrobacter sp.]
MSTIHRRGVLAGLTVFSGLVCVPSTARAQFGGTGLNLSSILGKATDSALDQLAEPGAFYNDEEVRIGLPIGGKSRSGLLGSVMDLGAKTGLLDDVVRQINDAAGMAAGEAKPIFRDAIDGLSFSDAPDIIQESDGGTQYLRRSSNDALHEKLTPLVDDALGELGVYKTVESLSRSNSLISQAGLNRETINKTVTDQGLDGIFTYVGKEERAFRKNPLGGVKGALGDIFGN